MIGSHQFVQKRRKLIFHRNRHAELYPWTFLNIKLKIYNRLPTPSRTKIKSMNISLTSLSYSENKTNKISTGKKTFSADATKERYKRLLLTYLNIGRKSLDHKGSISQTDPIEVVRQNFDAKLN
jgi:hypothetical protein